LLRERVSESIYVFTSELYAQVKAGFVVTKEGGILIDTLPFPVESQAMAEFAERTAPPGVRYVILTHYHADHTYGAYLYPQADVLAHERCRELLIEVGIPTLEEVQVDEPALEGVTLRLPEITFEDGELGLQLGERVLRILHTPGHTEDSTMVYVEDDHTLFAADTIMPVPSIVDGDIDAFRASLKKVHELPVENIVQGHGEVILRGEVQDVVQTSLDYLDVIEGKVEDALEDDQGREALEQDNIESTGLSRIPLNGLVQQIHTANLLYLYDQRQR
jgi:glyoxylase-like metal-dependent hydrolase (beta-lactamase superfamily II)